MKKPKAAAPPPCLHCELVEIIQRRHPAGMDYADANEVLRCLSLIAGDILQHSADGSAMMGFFEMIRARILINQQTLKIIDRTRH